MPERYGIKGAAILLGVCSQCKQGDEGRVVDLGAGGHRRSLCRVIECGYKSTDEREWQTA